MELVGGSFPCPTCPVPPKSCFVFTFLDSGINLNVTLSESNRSQSGDENNHRHKT